MRYFAGANAALGAPKGGIGNPPNNPRFGQDFRDLYLTAHFPILTERGVDFQIGRMNTIIGYNGFLAPYRPFYSSDYQFFYSSATTASSPPTGRSTPATTSSSTPRTAPSPAS
jgi:hypothetical protein